MGTPSIGKAALILTTDASGAREGLDQFGNDSRVAVKQIAARIRAEGQKASDEAGFAFEHTQSKLNKAFGKYAKKEGGFLGMLGGSAISDLGLGSTAAIVAGITIGVVQLRNALLDTLGYSEKFNNSLERSAQLNAETQKGLDRRLADKAAEITALGNDPAAAIGRMGTQIRDLNTELMGSASAATSARGELDKLSGLSIENVKDRIHLAHERRIQEVKEQLKAADTSAEKLRDTIQKLEIDRRKLRNPGPDLALLGDIQRATKELEFGNATRGMSEAEKMIERFRQREKGPTSAQLEDLIHVAKQNEFNVAYDASQKAFEELKLQIQDAQEFAGRTAEEVSVLKLERQAAKLKAEGKAGISNDQSEALRALLPERLPPWLGGALGAATAVMEQVSKLKNPATDNPALLKGSSAEVSARNRYETGARSSAERMLSQQAKGNQTLQEIRQVLAAIAAKPGFELLRF